MRTADQIARMKVGKRMLDQIISINDRYRIHAVWDEGESDVSLTLDRNDDGAPEQVAEWVIDRPLGLRAVSILDAVDIEGQGAADFEQVIDGAIGFARVCLRVMPGGDQGSLGWVQYFGETTAPKRNYKR